MPQHYHAEKPKMYMLGLISGTLLGIIVTVVAFYRFGEQANERYEEGTRRWEKGTEELRKAVRTLEISREENSSRSEKLKEICEVVGGVFEKNGLSEEAQKVRDLV